MTKVIYRGHEVVANDNASVKSQAHDAVYRGVHYDPSAAKPAANAPKSRVTYRGAKAA
ncbi:MAG: hypothetical protein R3C52_01740 [Hyphomonadaceae bacterium]